MSSMSVAITGVNVLGHTLADHRLLGIPVQPPTVPMPSGNDIMSLSDQVRDRVTLSASVRPSARPDHTAQRRRPLALQATRNTAAQTLAEMADSVTDRVTFSRREDARATQPSVYSVKATRSDEGTGETSAILDALAAEITDPVTLTTKPANTDIAPRRSTPAFARLSPVPAGA